MRSPELGEGLPSLVRGPLRDALDVSPALVMVFAGPEHRLAYQNGASAGCLGARPLGTPAADAFPDQPDWLLGVQRAWDSGEVVSLAAPMAADERPATESLHATCGRLAGPDGRPAAVILQAVDATAAHRADEEARWARALAQLSADLSTSLDPAEMARTVTRLGATVLGGWCVLDLWRPDGTLDRVAGTHPDPAMQPLLDRLAELPRVSGRATGRRSVAATVALTGELAIGRFSPELADHAISAEHTRILRRLGGADYLIVPLAVGTRRLGALSVLRRVGAPPFTPRDRAMTEELADRAAVALARVRAEDEQRQAVLMLQRNLLGADLAAADGVELASRYRAAGPGAEVGGDWYDAFRLEQGGIGVVVGDVQGHDLAAAVVMSQVRSVVHTHAREGLPPAQVIEHANRFLLESGSDRLVTLAYLQVFPAEGLVMWVRGGHLPAVVASPAGSAVVAGRGGLPLGVEGSTHWVEETIHLPPGAVLAVFTDGLVGSADGDVSTGIGRLGRLLEGVRPGDDLEAAADAVLDGMAGRSLRDGRRTDDVAMVLLRLRAPAEPGRSVVRRLPPASRSAPIARRFVTDLLPPWGVREEVVEVAGLLVTELVTNATRHSDGQVELRVELGERLRIAVFDDSHRLPALRQAGEWDPNGRGLQLVDALAERWGVQPEEGGKAVWFEL